MREIRTALIGVGAVNRSFLEILTRKAASSAKPIWVGFSGCAGGGQ